MGPRTRGQWNRGQRNNPLLGSATTNIAQHDENPRTRIRFICFVCASLGVCPMRLHACMSMLLPRAKMNRAETSAVEVFEWQTLTCCACCASEAYSSSFHLTGTSRAGVVVASLPRHSAYQKATSAPPLSTSRTPPLAPLHQAPHHQIGSDQTELYLTGQFVAYLYKFLLCPPFPLRKAEPYVGRATPHLSHKGPSLWETICCQPFLPRTVLNTRAHITVEPCPQAVPAPHPPHFVAPDTHKLEERHTSVKVHLHHLSWATASPHKCEIVRLAGRTHITLARAQRAAM